MADYFANWDEKNSWQNQLQNDPASRDFRAKRDANQGPGMGNYNSADYNATKPQDPNSMLGGATKGNLGQLGFGSTIQGYAGENTENTSYKPNGLGFQYGGQFGGAAQAAQGYGISASRADDRGAYQMNGAQQDQARGYQSAAAGSYMETLNGRNPSLAQLQLRQGMGQANASAAGMAASARGGGANMASAQRNAMRQQGSNISNYNQQAMMGRAQEIQSAQAGLAGVGGQMRGQDQGWQGAQAGLEMQQRGLNDQRNMGYAQLGANVNSQQLQANMAQERLTYEADRDQRQQNAAVQQRNVDRGNQNTKDFWDKIPIFSDENLKKDVTSLGAGSSRVQADNNSIASAYKAYAEQDSSGGPLNNSSITQGGEKKSGGMDLSSLMGGGGGGMGGMMGMFSDENCKQNVSDADALDMASKLEPKSFRYNWEDDSDPKRTGIMAQDMEKSEAGKSAVMETPVGKAIDMQKGVSLALAAVAAMKDEIDQLKGKRGRK